MADSIREHGIVQPPTARPGKYEGTYEVVFGQRRLLGLRREAERARAEKRPVPTTIQLLIREMEDQTVLEEAWVENLQRVDVGVREEVEGFQAMLDLKDEAGEPVYSVASLARKLGKDKSFISRRLKLAAVPEEMWQALEAGAIGVRQMALVGRLPDEGARKKAAGMVLRPKYRTEPPLTVKETMDLLREEFMVSLRGCEWDPKDALLVLPKIDKQGRRLSGGACVDCPFRTGSDPELQDALSGNQYEGGKQGIDANSCLLPSCYQAKKEAIWKRTMKEASESGAKVLSEDQARKVFPSWGSGAPMPSSGMVLLSDCPDYYATGHHAAEDTLPTWEKLIGKVPVEDLVVGRNEVTGAVCRMVKRERAIELAERSLDKQGVDSPFANRPGAKGETETRKESGPSEWDIKRLQRERMEEAVAGNMMALVDLQKTPSEELMTELVLGTLWDSLIYSDGLLGMMKERGMPEFDNEDEDDEKARAYLDEVVRPEVARAPMAWAALALMEVCDQMLNFTDPTQSDGILKALNLDREAILAQVEETAQESAEDAA